MGRSLLPPARAQGDGPSTIDLMHDAEYGAPRLLVLPIAINLRARSLSDLLLQAHTALQGLTTTRGFNANFEVGWRAFVPNQQAKGRLIANGVVAGSALSLVTNPRCCYTFACVGIPSVASAS